MSLEETWDGTATSPVAFLCFGVCTDQVAASCWAGFITSRQGSFSVISLLLTTAESVERSVADPFPRAVPLLSLRAGHGMEIIVTVVLGACGRPLSWMLYKYTDNASLHLKN